jgi:pimeloyl-ACP methyl ester carboxylesterase
MAKPPARRGYSATAKVAVQAGAARTQAMHGAIAARTFDILEAIPSISQGAGTVRRIHGAITSTVYAAIHRGSGLLLDAADVIEQKRSAPDADAAPPGRIASNLRSAINGAFGDELADMDSVLSIPMAVHRHGREVVLTPDALRAIWPDPPSGRRLCLFLHGLCYNEHCWEAKDGVDMPQRVESDFGCAALTLRYNTGLAVEDNGRQLATFLDRLCAVWPHPFDDVVIIGHSMGGLLARSALTHAVTAGLDWPARLRMVICLGTPHLGSPVERAGRMATTALGLTRITEPLAQIAARRSQGIRDLHDGLGAVDGSALQHVAWRFIGGSLAEDPQGPLGRLFGDGLVTPDSATANSIADAAHAVGDVQSIRLGGVSHMGLINDPRAYAQVSQWITENGAH